MMKKETILKLYFERNLYFARDLYLKFKNIIFPIVVTFSSLILIVFIIYPQMVKLISNNKAHGDVIKRSEFLEAKASALEELDEGDLTMKLGYALKAYPADKDFSEILDLLQTTANQKGFSVAAITIQPASKTSGNAQSYLARVEAVGPRSLLDEFIEKVESSNRVMKVSSIDITLAKDIDIADISLGVDVFFAPAPQTFGSADSPLPELTEEEKALIANLASSAVRTVEARPSSPSGPRGKLNPFE